ncbi:MAG: DUF5615 family PIN-like protein [Bacteroidota bacterium]|mgnify:CR=1 FL=1
MLSHWQPKKPEAMLKFIVDTQLPPRLAKFLASKGFDAIHTTHFPNGHLLTDADIIKIAIQDDRIIVSKDSDFFDNYILKGAPPKVLHLQFGNIGNPDLLNFIAKELAAISGFFENDGADLVIFSRTQLVWY